MRKRCRPTGLMRFLLLSLCLFSQPLTSPALGDGFFAPPRRLKPAELKKGVETHYLREPEQHAFLFFDGKEETLYLKVRSEGNVPEFGWIVPIPAPPTVELAKVDLVQDLAKFEYSLALEDYKAGRGKTTRAPMSLGGATGPAPAKKPEPVRVIERKRLGVFDLAVLRASDASALQSWLDQNQFSIPDTPRSRATLAHYVQAEMFFCAMRVVAKGSSQRWLEPIKIRFETVRPFFPLEISGMGEEHHDTEVYVHAFLPVDELSFTGRRRVGHHRFTQHERLFRVGDLPRSCDLFPALQHSPYSLTSFSAEKLNTAEMTDLWIATTDKQAQDAQIEYEWRTLPDRLDPWSANRGDEQRVDAWREFAVQFPQSKWGAEARRLIKDSGDSNLARTTTDCLKRAAQESANQRFREAILLCRHASQIDPAAKPRALELEAQILATERKFLESLQRSIRAAKKAALEQHEASEFFARAIDLLRLAADLHSTQTIHSTELKNESGRFARRELDWLIGLRPDSVTKRLRPTYEEAEWQLRRDASRSYRYLRLLELITRKPPISDKVEALTQSMRRGLR